MIWVYIFLFGMGLAGSDIFGDDLLDYRQKPRVLALLDTISYAEGTLKPTGYRTLFGGELFDSFDKHPERMACLMRRGKKLCTTGAGRYQIQKPTWKHYIENRKINSKTGDSSFSPLNQDRVAIQIMIDKGALLLLLREPIPFTDLFVRLGKAWSSMPGSSFGYDVYTVKQLQKIFLQQLALHEKRLALNDGDFAQEVRYL